MLNQNPPIYFDHNATTPLDPEVLSAMLPFMQNLHGNASSLHRQGRAARNAIEQARRDIADWMQVYPTQVIFTSGGSEANNLAIKGVAARAGKGEIVASIIEHDCVLESLRTLERQGFKIRYLPVDEQGLLKLNQLPEWLKSTTRLVAVMAANNETGVIQDTAAVRQILEGSPAKLLVDAVQAAGKIPLTFASSGAHLLTLSAHKLYGPKGVGALLVEPGTDIAPLIDGGGQELGYRSGTENVAGIVGFAYAAKLAQAHLAERTVYLNSLQQQLEVGLRSLGIAIIAEHSPRLPNTTLMALGGVDGETLLMWLDQAGFAVSSGSACSSGNARPSHVMAAMNVPQEFAGSTIRISLSHLNTADEIERFLSEIARIAANLQKAWS